MPYCLNWYLYLKIVKRKVIASKRKVGSGKRVFSDEQFQYNQH